MSVSFDLHAVTRTDLGKGASRRLRRSEQVPAVVYGAHKEPQSITLDHKKVTLALKNEAFYSHILNLHIDGQTTQAILKDVHRHPYKQMVLHMDFQRVSASEAINVHVPLHFLNEASAPGVKEGGIINKHLNEVEVRCLPKHLPEYLEVDCGNLTLDATLHLSDLSLPAGIELVALSHNHDNTVVSVHQSRAAKDEASAESSEAAPAAEEKSSK